MTCPHCGSTNAENARFCVSCGQALPRVCPRCGAINPPGARFCNQCGLALDDAPGPMAFEPHTATPEETEQRRIVTVLFADLANSTSLTESLDAEEMRAILAEFFAAMTREIHRHGGSIEKYIGDAIMAVFGLPVAHEDDPVRAVRAALAMQDALTTLNANLARGDGLDGLGGARPHLSLRIGINTGEVAASASAREGQDFLITGDPVNVAARLQQVAEPGKILVGPRTYRSARGLVEFRQAPAMALRGKARPVTIWEVVRLLDDPNAPSARPNLADSAQTPLIGRDSEMTVLEAVGRRTLVERRPHLVTILGAPGVGKTRLARDFIDRLSMPANPTTDDQQRPPQRIEGRCPPYGEDVTYWPLIEMMRCYAGFSAITPPEETRARVLGAVRVALKNAGRQDNPDILAAYLGHTIGIETAERRRALLPTDATQLQEGALKAWSVFFEAAAADGGLVAMVDDAHWADDALLDLLAYVTSRASGVPLLFVLTARPDLIERRPNWGGGRRNYMTLELEPLSPDGASRLLDVLLPGAEVPTSLRHIILDKADGNPFYVGEIVRMLIDRGALLQDDTGEWRVTPEWTSSEEIQDPLIPDTVQGVLAARLDLLSAIDRDVMQHAAVIGRFFWPGALLHLSGHLSREELDASLKSLMEKDLIQLSDRAAFVAIAPDEPAYAFNHTLTREVVYSTIPRTRRAQEHLRIADWIEAMSRTQPEVFAELLALHYYRYYKLANLSRSRDQARRGQTRRKVVEALRHAGEQSIARHALAKADGYFSDALELFGEEIDPSDAPLVVALRAARGAERWLALRPDDAWNDYREALHVWAATSDAIAVNVPAEAPLALATPVASSRASQPAAVSEPGAQRSPVLPSTLPLDWRQQGIRLYRVLAQLPSRWKGLFRRPPSIDEVSAYLDEGLRLADELGQRDTLEYAELLTAKSFFWWSRADQRTERELLDAYRSAREAVRISEALDDAHAASAALDALGNIQSIMTDLNGYLESQRRRLRWIPQLDEPAEIVDINTEVSQAYQQVGAFEDSVRHAQIALTLAHEVDSDVLRAKALWCMTLAQFESDHWSETIQAGSELQACAQFTVLRNSHHYGWAILALATLAARTGDADTAERLTRMVNDANYSPAQELELARARLALARGAPRDAQQLMLNALDLNAGRHSMSALMSELAELAARGGDIDLYDRFGAEALELGWRSGARKALAQAIRARAIVAVSAGRWDDGLADARNALDRYRDLGCGWEEARSRYVLAGLYRRRGERGDDERAGEELALALRLFEDVRSVRDIARVRAALAGGDVRLP